MVLFEVFGLTLDFQPLFDELKNWWTGFLQLLPNLLVGILVALVGMVVTRMTKKYFDRLGAKLVKDKILANLLSSALTVALGLLFLFLVLSVLELDGTVKSLLAGAGVVGLAVGLAFQDPILNFFSGVILTVRHLFSPGDIVEIDGYFGKVRQITLRHTALETFQGQEVLIPNKTVAQSPIKNYNKLNRRRVDIACGVSYGDDLKKVEKITVAAIKDQVPHDTDKPVDLVFEEFGGSSINYSLRFWLTPEQLAQGDFLAARSKAIMAIVEAYNEHDIMIPFPIRTLDFGIKGGEKLSAMLASRMNGKNREESSENQPQEDPAHYN
ncbi:mechanosensitive ion channel family protein [Lewinella sp. W8]|uniref:mechanosensitive ion channel family protein n=1 Tax=Lewinella sp. W8 TaxID=2528208 RepID=UPI0010683E47|nr:mechanosensitive ion channel family protein [Lewinella sp. W8]MTB50923.1 mechanosensitive ion channel [Lewinella sp. W8]